MRRRSINRRGPIPRRRTFFSLMVALALLVGACSTPSPEGTTAPQATTAPGGTTTEGTAAETTTTEGTGTDEEFTLVVALASDPQHMNNGLTTDLATILIANQVYEPLVTMDENGDIHPHLAESWEFNDDSTTLSIKLRDDVLWHDGEPFTAEDVAFTFLELSGQFNGQGTAAYSVIDTIDIVDDHNLVINFAEVTPSFFPWSLVQTTYALIYPKHIFEVGDPLENPANEAPVGTGPFVFEEWQRGNRIVFTRNEDYWQEGLPFADRLIFQIIAAPEARTNSIITGAIDYIPYQYFPLAAYAELDANPDVEVVGRPRPQAGMNLMFYNLRQPPLDDVRVRQAIAYAIDRDAILANATDGLMLPGVALIGTSDAFFSEPSNIYPRDVALANQLLDEAGLAPDGNGTRLSLRMSYDSAVFAGSLELSAQIMRENLREVGIELELQPMDNATWAETAAVNWDFDLTMGSFGVGPDPATGVNRLVLCEAIEPRLGRNTSGYCNPEVDELMIAAASEPDFDTRADLYSQAQEIISAEVPMLPIWENAYFVAFSADLEGLPQGIFMQESLMHVKRRG